MVYLNKKIPDITGMHNRNNTQIVNILHKNMNIFLFSNYFPDKNGE